MASRSTSGGPRPTTKVVDLQVDLNPYGGSMTMAESRYRIAAVAARTGFSAPTLRYYEQIGLLSPAERTEAGYRLYDERAVERLSFIARAKRLGCTLEEIADLAEAWDSNECAPI